jgi:hypothetical protein
LTSTSIYQSQSYNNSWICYDFKTTRIKPTHYTVRSRNDYDGYHPKNRVIEGSVDGSSWIELGRENTDQLVGLNRISTFSLSKTVEVRMIRIQMIGNESNESYCFTISALEFFGDLFNADESTASLKQQNTVENDSDCLPFE